MTATEILVDRAAKFARKYFPTEEMVQKEVASDGMNHMAFVKVAIEHLTGKAVHEK